MENSASGGAAVSTTVRGAPPAPGLPEAVQSAEVTRVIPQRGEEDRAIDALLRACLRNRLALFLLAILIACGGYYASTRPTVEAFPDPSDTQVQVISLYAGQPTEEVERRASIPLERVLKGTPALFRLRSISLFGLSMVTLTFEDGVDSLVARQQVLERIIGTELPEGVQPGVGPLYTPHSELPDFSTQLRHSLVHGLPISGPWLAA
jgi:Cu/Ag efflux pump CusA